MSQQTAQHFVMVAGSWLAFLAGLVVFTLKLLSRKP